MDLEPYDFGPVSVVPDECCDDYDYGDVTGTEKPVTSPVRSVFVIIAHDNDPVCDCKDRKFTVNLHKDGGWSFTFTNGEFLSEEEKKLYCKEIAGAQSYLDSQERFRQRGKGLGFWDPNRNRSANNGDTSVDDVRYFPASNGGNDFYGKCSIKGPLNI